MFSNQTQIWNIINTQYILSSMPDVPISSYVRGKPHRIRYYWHDRAPCANAGVMTLQKAWVPSVGGSLVVGNMKNDDGRQGARCPYELWGKRTLELRPICSPSHSHTTNTQSYHAHIPIPPGGLPVCREPARTRVRHQYPADIIFVPALPVKYAHTFEDSDSDSDSNNSNAHFRKDCALGVCYGGDDGKGYKINLNKTTCVYS